MKYALALLLLMLMNTISAQDTYLKLAEDLLNDYKKSKVTSTLEAAKQNADEAAYNSHTRMQFKAWELRAEIYDNMYKNTVLVKRYGKRNLLEMRFRSLVKAFDLIPEKPNLKSTDVYAQVQQLGLMVYDRGRNEFDSLKYEEAYYYFASTVNFSNFLAKNGPDRSQHIRKERDTAFMYGGEAAYRVNMFREAVPFLEKTIEQVDKSPRFYGYLIESYEATCQIKKANKLKSSLGYVAAKASGGKDIEFRYNMARSKMLTGNLDEAVTGFTHILEDEPDHYLSKYNQGLIYFNQAKDWDFKKTEAEAMSGKGTATSRQLQNSRDELLKKALNNFSDLLFHPDADIVELKRLYDEALSMKLR